MYIDREPHFMTRTIKESVYTNALDASEKIMNLEKGHVFSFNRCDSLYFCIEKIIVDEKFSKHCTLIVVLRKTSVRCCNIEKYDMCWKLQSYLFYITRSIGGIMSRCLVSFLVWSCTSEQVEKTTSLRETCLEIRPPPNMQLRA